MTRKTIEGIKQLINTGGTVGATAHLSIVKLTGGDTIGFTAKITVGSEAFNVAATNNGKIKVFANVDDFVKAAAALQLTSLGLANITFDNPGYLDAKPFTGDPVKKAQSNKAKFESKKAKLVADIADLQTAINLMPHVTAAEQALVDERNAQKAAMQGSVDYFTAQIAAINTALGL